MPDKSLQSSPTIVLETVTALLTSGSVTKAAAYLGISRASFYERMERYPQIKEEIDKIPQRALETLKQGSLRAAEVFVEQLDVRDNKMEAAKQILDRVGVGTKQSVVAVQVNNNMSSLEFVEDSP